MLKSSSWQSRLVHDRERKVTYPSAGSDCRRSYQVKVAAACHAVMTSKVTVTLSGRLAQS